MSVLGIELVSSTTTSALNCWDIFLAHNQHFYILGIFDKSICCFFSKLIHTRLCLHYLVKMVILKTWLQMAGKKEREGLETSLSDEM